MSFLIQITYKIPNNIPQKDLQMANDILKKFFGENWLNKNEGHPIQLLWSKSDPLALLELYSLGSSILNIENKDPQWIKEKIKRIKSGDKGATFEILAAAMFEKGTNHEVFFPSGDNPGFDLIVKFKDNAKMNVSCKSHRKSKHSELFNKESKQFNKIFVYLCKCLNIKNIQCLISSNKYPHENPDWIKLNGGIQHALLYTIIDGISDKSKSYRCDNWIINISSIPEYKKDLSDIALSYNLGIVAPFHKNEFRNLNDHLDDAIHNLSKQKIAQDEDNINIIFVNLGENYSFKVIEEWAKDYLKQNNTDYIAGIYFQRGHITYKLDLKDFGVVYSYKLIKTNSYDIWNSEKEERLVNIISPMNKYAMHSGNDFERELMSEKDGKVRTLGIKDSNIYVYHNGELYLKYNKNLRHKISTPGLKRYLVKNTKEGVEIHYFDAPTEDNFTLL